MANDPELHVFYTAKKLFPDDIAYFEKLEKVNDKYDGALLSKFEELYGLYYKLSKERPHRRQKVSATDADNILAELLISGP